jgi:cytochrome c
MPAHPAISLNDARVIVNYMLNIRDKNIRTLPLKGSFTQKIPSGDNGNGTVIVRAAYTDKGAPAATNLTTETVVVLHSPNLEPASADIMKGAEIKKQIMFVVSENVIPKANGYIGFKNIDLTGIRQLELNATANPSEGFTGGSIEIRLDGAQGELLGQADVKPVNPFAALMSAANATQSAGGKTGTNKDSAHAKKPAAKKSPRRSLADLDLVALFAGQAIKTDIKEVAGKHDLYFVFKNDKAKPDQPLLSFTNIKFDDVKSK